MAKGKVERSKGNGEGPYFQEICAWKSFEILVCDAQRKAEG
jgi:hypothetical protein